jgi:hypothetical protein
MPAAMAAVVSQTKPSVLERGIGENAARKLKDITPDATRALRDMVERKRQGQDGHAR